MDYTFKELQQINTYSNNTAFLSELNPLQIEQLKLAILPHVEFTGGDVNTFKNCFFPVYPNNEGGIERITFYEVLNSNKDVVYNFVRVDVTAGTFFERNTTTIMTSIWANEFESSNQNKSEIEHLALAWKALQLQN